MRDGNVKKRTRKFHRKSRQACINCRFRRVKCDETRPECSRCRDYMIPCHYSGDVVDLLNVRETICSIITQQCPAEPLLQVIQPSIDPKHEFIVRFQQRTALTFGTVETVSLYAEAVPRLALRHDFLLHAIIATTMFHEQALKRSAHPTTTTAYHLTESAGLFNRRLSNAQEHTEGDALWATSVYLCAMSIFNLSSLNSEQNWPMSAPHPTDLEWLKMQAGLRVIWNMADMERSSVFGRAESKGSTNCVQPIEPESGTAGIPPLLVKMCQLQECRSTNNGPYHTAVRRLTALLNVNGTPENVLTFMVFAGGMDNAFRQLLIEKDPVALLVLALWHSKLFHSVWWMVPRARVECQSICYYLHDLEPVNEAFQDILATLERAIKTWDSDLPAAYLIKARQPRYSPAKACPTSIRLDMFWDG